MVHQLRKGRAGVQNLWWDCPYITAFRYDFRIERLLMRCYYAKDRTLGGAPTGGIDEVIEIDMHELHHVFYSGFEHAVPLSRGDDVPPLPDDSEWFGALRIQRLEMVNRRSDCCGGQQVRALGMMRSPMFVSLDAPGAALSPRTSEMSSAMSDDALAEMSARAVTPKPKPKPKLERRGCAPIALCVPARLPFCASAPSSRYCRLGCNSGRVHGL